MQNKRILLKLSGEALAAPDGSIYDHGFVDRVASVLAECARQGYELGVVIGAGNIWRGRQGDGMDRITADRMGMLATVINALCMKDAIERAGADCAVLTAIPVSPFAEPYSSDLAGRYLAEGRIVLMGAGLGAPFFSTDTAGAVRAAEIGADLMLMAKNVDFIYDSDPRINPNAVRFESITASEVLRRGLRAIDGTATAFCLDAKIPIRIFGLREPEDILRAVRGETIGTVVTPE